jgi:protein transport protein SEC24
MASSHGKFSVRSADLKAIQIENAITALSVVLQTAITTHDTSWRGLYSCHQLALPTTSSLSEIFASADRVANATPLANKAMERFLSHKPMRFCNAWRTSCRRVNVVTGAGASAQLDISGNLNMLFSDC